MNPKSRGRIRLKSKNPFKWPDITRNSFGDKNDLTVLIEGIQKVKTFHLLTKKYFN